MKTGDRVKIKKGDRRGRVAVVRSAYKNAAGIAVAMVDFADGLGVELPASALAVQTSKGGGVK
ncbi:MAG: hypothetical protein U0932_01030 [Thiobacillus sp.]|nr:hypothetical protein [Thiobacillus sp.]